MDFEHQDNHGFSENPESSRAADRPADPEPAREKIVYVEKPPKKSGFRFFWRIVFILSILANCFLFLMLIGVSAAAFLGAGQTGFYVEEVIRDGDAAKKIAVIRLEGIINKEVSKEVCRQIKSAGEDDAVMGLIIRTNTPGGGVAASDQINHEITRFRRRTNKPVVAFMQSMATSGGYYTSVACNSIVAEPTVITGSIGVIMQHFVLKDLMEQKLGVNPVTIKSGEKKGWPSTFEPPTEDQIAYLDTKIIQPAYTRFVELVTIGRAGVLNGDQVSGLADGSIYSAREALDNKLIDQIGFIEEAIAAAESLAGVSGAKVVEYTKPFSLASVLGAQGKFGINIDRGLIEDMAVPKVRYLWEPF